MTNQEMADRIRDLERTLEATLSLMWDMTAAFKADGQMSDKYVQVSKLSINFSNTLEQRLPLPDQTGDL